MRPLFHLAFAALVLGGWCVWLTCARVGLHAKTDRARIEARQVSAVEAAQSGKVVSVQLVLGRNVEKGDILVRLETGVVDARLEEARARLQALASRAESRRVELSAETELRRRRKRAADTAVGVSVAQLDDAQSRASVSKEDAERAERLTSAGSLSDVEARRAKAEAAQSVAKRNAAGMEVLQHQFRGDADEAEVDVRIARLRTEIVDITSQEQALSAGVDALVRERESHDIRAPSSGRIAELAVVQVGAFLRAGDRVATIVGDSELYAVALFEPASALGRLRPGQRARLRLDGFPWARFGSFGAIVTSVASEVRDESIRVELMLVPDASGLVTFQHGLPGQIEVEVEQIAPWDLLLRLAGAGIRSPAAPLPSSSVRL